MARRCASWYQTTETAPGPGCTLIPVSGRNGAAVAGGDVGRPTRAVAAQASATRQRVLVRKVAPAFLRVSVGGPGPSRSGNGAYRAHRPQWDVREHRVG